MRYVLYLLLVMAVGLMVHGVVIDSIFDTMIWAFGVAVVSLLIKVENHERDDE